MLSSTAKGELLMWSLSCRNSPVSFPQLLSLITATLTTTTPTLRSLHSNDRPASAAVQQYVVVSVDDCGAGIPSEVMENLFRPLSQTVRLAGGAGLGLFTLQHRVAALGGQCGVLSRPDGSQGSVFWFSFPYMAGSLVPQSVPTNAAFHPLRRLSVRRNSTDSLSPSRKTSAAPALRILLVDDSLPVLKMVQAALEKLGHQVFTAKNGARGLAEMQRLALQPAKGEEAALDLVLMDIQMPVMDGVEATRRFRELEGLSSLFSTTTSLILQSTTSKSDLSDGGDGLGKSNRSSRQFSVGGGKNRHLAIIGMSANSDSTTMSMALAAGMDHFMPKPFSLKEFELVTQHLKLRSRD